MTKAAPVIDRKEHARIIGHGKPLVQCLFNPLTLESITQIEAALRDLKLTTGRGYVAVPVGQPHGGPKYFMALIRTEVEAVHRAYRAGKLRGISPEIGRVYDFEALRRLSENGASEFNPGNYPPEFLDYLRAHFAKR